MRRGVEIAKGAFPFPTHLLLEIQGAGRAPLDLDGTRAYLPVDLGAERPLHTEAATLLDRDRTPVTLFPSELVVRQSA